MMGLALSIVAKTLFNSDVADESRNVAEAIEVIMAYFLKPNRLLPFARRCRVAKTASSAPRSGKWTTSSLESSTADAPKEPTPATYSAIARRA